MSADKPKSKSSPAKTNPPGKPAQPAAVAAAGSQEPPAVPKLPPLFRRIDWMTLLLTALVAFIGFYLTEAPDLTLEDSGELATGSFYAGVPHPPGYPLWTIFTWLFTVLLPVANVAYRVGIASAVSGALACGTLALIVSRGSSMMIESIAEFKNIDRKLENAICMVSGFVAGTLLAYNGYMWSQSVIVEVYPFSVFSLMGVVACLMRWVYAPHQKRFLYFAWLLFGICFTNHQTLIVAAMGIEIAIVVVSPKLGRDLLFLNSIAYIIGAPVLWLGLLGTFQPNPMVITIFHIVGILSCLACAALNLMTRKMANDWKTLGSDLLLGVSAVYLLYVFLVVVEYAPAPNLRSGWIFWIHLGGLACMAGCIWLAVPRKAGPAAPSPGAPNVPHNVLYAAGALFLLTLIFLTVHGLGFLKQDFVVFWAYMFLGLIIFAACFWQLSRKWHLGVELLPCLFMFFLWGVGFCFYFYMPVSSMTNPPMNWGYPRTVDGFIHALTRGQYEKTNPTDFLTWDGLQRFGMQLGMYLDGAREEFNLVNLTLALIPFFFFFRLQKRERSWLIGLTAIWFFLAILLMVLLNPAPDRATKDLIKVFFTSSYTVIAMMIGYGLTLICAFMVSQYERFRPWGIGGGVVAIGLGIYTLAMTLSDRLDKPLHAIMHSFAKDQYSLPLHADFLLLALACVFLAVVVIRKSKPMINVALAVFALLPVHSMMSHWSDNEQRNHYFGFWFGHDMFTPPFGLYPEMTRDAVLFGGTDPGRFAPTYMIFCESFLPPAKRTIDKNFDRRDVYIITQNALADATYLEYIRAQYNRSTQIDPPFFQELLRSPTEVHDDAKTNYLARLAYDVLDKPFLALGAHVEKRRREEGVYPKKEIYCPTADDSGNTFQQYIADAQERAMHDQQHPNEPRQIRPGEEVHIVDNRVSVSGQVAVMAINGLLTKVIFDHNPSNEFYVEESFPLDWMFPHLTPFGVIMKINRNPVPEITQEIVDRDHKFWTEYSDRLVGNWITYDTTVKEIADFVEKVYVLRDFSGFKGDRKFIRDDDAQKAFSKLRSSIGGIYAWRISQLGTTPTYPPEYNAYVKLNAAEQRHDNAAIKAAEAERDRMIRETDFALKQAFAFCPYSPEAVMRYVQFLASYTRYDDAILVVKTCLKLDPENAQMVGLEANLEHVRGMGGSSPQAANDQAQANLAQLEQVVHGNSNNLSNVFTLVAAYMAMREPEKAMPYLDQIVSSPAASRDLLVGAAQSYAQINNFGKLETALERLVQIDSNSPEAFYDLAATKVINGKTAEAMRTLEKSLALNAARTKTDPGKSAELLDRLRADPHMAPLRALPDYQRLVPAK